MRISWTLLGIFLVAAFFRLYALSHVPPSPSLDEVTIGYNAYSILKTGADEYGTKFPILLRAYDDWRPALYVYLVIPAVYVLGLSITAVRIPSVILSLGTVVVTYYIARELAREKKSPIPSITAFFLAISPWHIYLSRLGHEVNLGLATVVVGTWLLIRFLKTPSNAYVLIASSVAFALSLYSYQSQKVVVPILLLCAGILFWKEFFHHWKATIAAIAVGVLLSVPIVLASLSPQALVRFRATSAFADPTATEANNRQFVLAKARGDMAGQIYFHPATVPLKIFLGNYVSHFRPGWLFFGGMFESHKIPGMGLLYWWEIVTIPIGIWIVAKSNMQKNLKLFVFVWFFAAPIPAALTTQAPHAMRSFTFLPLWQLFSATGLVGLISWLRLRYLQLSASIALVFGIVIAVAIFTKQYFVAFPVLQSESFQYPLAQAIAYVAKLEGSYDQVVFSNQDGLYQSYMFFLFFTKYDPASYQRLGGTISGGYSEVHSVGKFQFRPIAWEKEKHTSRTLFIGNSSEFPGDVSTVAEFKALDGSVNIKIIQT